MNKTQVVIIGAGPSGLLLARLLERADVSTIVLELHTRAHVEARIRAGVLEQGTVDLLHEAGVDARLRRDGLRQEGFGLAFDGRMHRIDVEALTGKSVTVYGQTEVQKDLADAHLASGGLFIIRSNKWSSRIWKARKRASHSCKMGLDMKSSATLSPAATDFTASPDKPFRSTNASITSESTPSVGSGFSSTDHRCAASDVGILQRALIRYYKTNDADSLGAYSDAALSRVWKATRFSWWLTSLMHKFSDDSFAHRLQLAELDYISRSPAASKVVAENYVGLDLA